MSSLKSLAALLVACCGVLFPAAPAHASTHEVMIHNYAYAPASLVVAQGDTVTWTNMDSAQHDVTVTKGATAFRSPMLAQGKSWSYTFATAGSYSYICSVHPDMKASVVVRAAAPSTPRATAAAPVKATRTAVAAPASPTKVATTPPAHVATGSTQAAAAATSPVVTTAADPAEATLSPLLIVLGLSAAVMVFCLLLIASRPQAVVVTSDVDELDFDELDVDELDEV